MFYDFDILAWKDNNYNGVTISKILVCFRNSKNNTNKKYFLIIGNYSKELSEPSYHTFKNVSVIPCPKIHCVKDYIKNNMSGTDNNLMDGENRNTHDNIYLYQIMLILKTHIAIYIEDSQIFDQNKKKLECVLSELFKWRL